MSCIRKLSMMSLPSSPKTVFSNSHQARAIQDDADIIETAAPQSNELRAKAPHKKSKNNKKNNSNK